MWPARCPSWARTDWLVGAQQSGRDALLQTPGARSPGDSSGRGLWAGAVLTSGTPTEPSRVAGSQARREASHMLASNSA